MKTRSIFSILLASLLIVGFVACSDDDDNKNSNKPTNERENDLSRMEASLLRDNPDPNETNRIPAIGKAIYKATPTIFYVGVEDIVEAKESFLSFVNDEIDRVEVADNITLNLKDSKNEPQGNIYFTALEENDNGYLAEVTFAPEDMFPEITKIIYIKNDSWPNMGFQATSPYKYLKSYRVNSDSEHGYPTGLCIKEYTNGNNGIIIVPLTTNGSYYNHTSNTCDETLHKFAKYIKDSKIADEVDAALKDLGLGKLDEYYWSSNSHDHGLWANRYTVNLKTNDEKRISSWDIALDSNTGKNFLGYWFDNNGNCW